MMVHFMTVSLTLWLGHSQLMIKQSLSLLVLQMLITLSEWLESVSPTDQYGSDCSWFLLSVRLWAVGSLSNSHCWRQTRSGDDGCPWHSKCVLWYSTGNMWSLLCQLSASGWAICTGVQCQKYCPCEASYQLGQCPLRNQELYVKHHFEVSWSIRCVWLSYWWGHCQACSYKVLLFIVDLKMSNGLMPAASKLMMLSRLLIMPDVDHAVQIIGVYLCLLVLRPRRSMVLQDSHIMNAPGILWNTPPVHISGGQHLKARSLVWGHLFLLSEGRRWFGGGPLWETGTPGSQFDRKQCLERFVTPLSCFPHSRCNSLAFWTPVLLCLLPDLYT